MMHVLLCTAVCQNRLKQCLTVSPWLSSYQVMLLWGYCQSEMNGAVRGLLRSHGNIGDIFGQKSPFFYGQTMVVVHDMPSFPNSLNKCCHGWLYYFVNIFVVLVLTTVVAIFLGCAFVRMQTKNDAEKCIAQLHNCMTLPVSSLVVLTKLITFVGESQNVLVLGSLLAPPRCCFIQNLIVVL